MGVTADGQPVYTAVRWWRMMYARPWARNGGHVTIGTHVTQLVSYKHAPFDRARTISYSTLIESMPLSWTFFELRDFLLVSYSDLGSRWNRCWVISHLIQQNYNPQQQQQQQKQHCRVFNESISPCDAVKKWSRKYFVFSVLWRCWLGGRKGIRPVKTEWWDVGMAMWLGQGADLHIAQLMSLPLTVSCSSKSTFVLPFWCRFTRVVPDKGPLNGCCCCYLLRRRRLCFWFGLFVCLSDCLTVRRITRKLVNGFWRNFLEG